MLENSSHLVEATLRDRPLDAPPVTIRGHHTILDYLFFVRPVLLPPVWTIALLGTVAVDRTGVAAWQWIVLFLQLFCLFGAVYTLNQIFDVESDRANRKLFFLPEGLITIPAAWRFTVALDLVALALAVPLGMTYMVLTCAIILLGVVYSVGPRPWKNHPLLGFAANVVAHGLIVHAMGVAFAEGALADTWVMSLAYGLAVGGVYLATTVADADGDRQSGKKTLAVTIGVKPAMLCATILVLAAIAVAASQNDSHLTIAAACALPLFVWSAFAAGSRWAPLAAKAGVGALSVAAAISYPIYAILLVVGFFATRAFFRWRFGFTYPSLGPGR